jgi:hypothetical protein
MMERPAHRVPPAARGIAQCVQRRAVLDGEVVEHERAPRLSLLHWSLAEDLLVTRASHVLSGAHLRAHVLEVDVGVVVHEVLRFVIYLGVFALLVEALCADVLSRASRADAEVRLRDVGEL